MAFKDITIPDEDEMRTGTKYRRKIHTLIGRRNNEKALIGIGINDTVEVKLEGIVKKGIVKHINPTTAIIFVPETNEMWKVSGFYLTKVTGRGKVL